MTRGDVEFRESTAERRVEQVPLSHLSIELGHFYFDELRQRPEVFATHFQRLAPWVTAAREMCAQTTGGRRARLSTCPLIDAYLTDLPSPRAVILMLVTLL